MGQATLELNEVFLRHPVLMRIIFRFMETDFRIINSSHGLIADEEKFRALDHNRPTIEDEKTAEINKVNEEISVKTEVKEKYSNEKKIEDKPNAFSNYISRYYYAAADNLKKLMKFYNDVIIRRVPKYIIGEGVFGRAFLHHNVIEILDSLVGEDFQKVLAHERYHIMNPGASEYQTRVVTNTLYFRPNGY